MNMQQIIEHLKSSIASHEQNGDNMDEVSWGYQNGILISANEAKQILNAIESAPTEPQTVKRSAEEMLDEAIGDNCTGFHKLEEYSWILPVMHEYAQQFVPNLSLPGDEDVKRWFQLLVCFSDGKERMEKDMRETWLQKQINSGK